MKSYSKLDKEIFWEFYGDKSRLKFEADKIRNQTTKYVLGTENSLKINYNKLEDNYRLFRQFIEEKDSPFYSFDHPYIQKNESYKEKVASSGREKLNAISWKKSMIGTGEILGYVRNAINVEDNNLLIHDNRNGEKGRQDKSLYLQHSIKELTEYEQVLYNFYRDIDPDEESLNKLVDIVGKIYPFISYLFFLKSSKKYLPIAPDTFDKVFKKLGLGFTTSHKCSWENYSQYLYIAEQVREFLEIQDDIKDEKVSLLDAHSFMWILGSDFFMGKWKPREKTEKKTIEIHFESILPIKRKIKDSLSLREYGDFDIDFEKKSKRNRRLGKKSEQVVLQYEREKLIRAGREDLLEKVVDVSRRIGLGYDIESVNLNEEDIRIEVKTEGVNNSFLMSINEIRKASEIENYYIYVVSNPESTKPSITAIEVNDILGELTSIPITYRVYFQK